MTITARSAEAGKHVAVDIAASAVKVDVILQRVANMATMFLRQHVNAGFWSS